MALTLARDDAARWAYLAFALTMLRAVQRARTKDVAKENLLSFFAALLPAELAHKFLALNAGVVIWLRRSRTPVLAGWVGAVAGCVQCVAVLRLSEMWRDNVSAKRAIRAAMAAQSDIEPSKLRRLGDLSARNWLSVLLPLPQTTALALSFPGVANIGSVVYAHVGSNSATRLKMDVYRHRDIQPGAPIFLYIHGGAWVMGDRKNPPRPLIHQVAALGWLVCVIDYRLSPKVAFPSHLIDSKRAPGFEHVDTSVRGCVDTYGVHDFTDRHGVFFYKDKSYSFVRFIELVVMQKKLKDAARAFDQASPVSWVQHGQELQNGGDAPALAAAVRVVPPFLVSHGTYDTLVPFQDSLLFFESLQKFRERQQRALGLSSSAAAPDGLAGGSVQDVFLEIPDAHHAFNYLVSPRALAFGEAVCAFLDNLQAKTKHLPLGTLVPATRTAPLSGAAVAVAAPRGGESEDPLTTFSSSAEMPSRAGPTASRL
ncbi:hypothetical protein PybrP1_011730 [[Pythium] brassicae (nom. inval.)]|nr:hypothetical protein PybrP1_011730 [[Pythium] brassicae (nom. inval.)]